MPANDAFHIAVLPGDGIGPEVMAPALDILRKIEETTPGLKFRFTEAPAGAGIIATPASRCRNRPSSSARRPTPSCSAPAACRSIRYPDNTEIMPQVELRFIFDLYAGVRPAGSFPACRRPIVGAAERGIDLRADPRIDRGPVRLDGQGRRHA